MASALTPTAPGNLTLSPSCHAFMALGVGAYVTKPVKTQDLYEKITAAYDKPNPD